MIKAKNFIESARQSGFTRYAGVPCSFLTPFINYVINDDSLEYVSSANEGDAIATAAGLAIGGQRSIVMFQNSGLGNAVNPVTSLLHTFRIPVLIIVTHRGDPSLSDEPQHDLMGRITGNLLDTLNVPWEMFPDQESGISAAMDRACIYMNEKQLPYALLMKKSTVSDNIPLKPGGSHNKHPDGVYREQLSERPGPAFRHEILRSITEMTDSKDTVIVATTGYTGRELFAINDRENHLYMVGSMGCASSLALGISLARPELKVVVIDGDGAALMRMGNMATIGTYAGRNFVHLLLDNEAHESTGGQSTVSANVNFAAIAKACNYPLAYYGNDPGILTSLLDDHDHTGPRFAQIKIRQGSMQNLPRPALSPADAVRRLMAHLGTAF